MRWLVALVLIGALALAAAPVAAADGALRPIPVPQAAPVGIDGAHGGVHPGALVETPKGYCTMNFLFSGSNGARYIATAGHCILGNSELGGENAGERSWGAGRGPVARDANGRRIGRFAYAILREPKDFSLIRLDPGVAASAAMPHFGGPTGIDTSRSSQRVLLHYFGEGVLFGDVLPARSAVAFGTPNPDHVYAQGAIAPGDSGAAIETADGRAVGVIVTFGGHTGSVGTRSVDAGDMGITRLPPQLARAEQVLRIGLRLRTARLR